MTSTTENRLKNSASPYLRSAAHQPIDWHEWGEEAFEKARAEGKPVLLDIGAVWCHWCHVIDRESYENPEIAAIINELYIPVKVDRDERPDVDARYQSAISAISGQGGWPLTGFLTPDGKPFFGGTYFPPDDMQGRPGFRRVLLGIAEAFQTRRGEVDNSAAGARRSRGASGDFSRRARRIRRRRGRCGGRLGASAIRRNARRLRPVAEISALRGDRPSARTRQLAAAARSCKQSSRKLSTAWPPADFTIRSAADFIAIRSTSAGACRTSRKCPTTIPSC